MVRLLLDHKGKFNTILHDLKKNFDELKNKFNKLEPGVNVSTNVNSNLSGKSIYVEKKSFVNQQFSRRECLENSNITPSVKDNELNTTVFSILKDPRRPWIGRGLSLLTIQGKLREGDFEIQNKPEVKYTTVVPCFLNLPYF